MSLPLVYRRLDFAAMGVDLQAVPAILHWAEWLGFDGAPNGSRAASGSISSN